MSCLFLSLSLHDKNSFSSSNTLYMSKKKQQLLLYTNVDTGARNTDLPTPAPATPSKARMQQQ